MEGERKLVEQFIVGIVKSPHGISGEFKVESTSGKREHFSRMKEVALRKSATSESRSFKVERVEIGGLDLYMKLCGIDSVEEAKKFSSFEIVVPRENACPLNADEWYIEDLKGCDLVYEEKNGLAGNPTKVGVVADVMEGGCGDLLEVVIAEDCEILSDSVKYSITKDGTKKVRTVFVPLKKEAGFIGDIDVKRGKIELMHLWILE